MEVKEGAQQTKEQVEWKGALCARRTPRRSANTKRHRPRDLALAGRERMGCRGGVVPHTEGQTGQGGVKTTRGAPGPNYWTPLTKKRNQATLQACDQHWASSEGTTDDCLGPHKVNESALKIAFRTFRNMEVVFLKSQCRGFCNKVIVTFVVAQSTV